MPEYVGEGKNFYLVKCELMPSPTASKQEKIRFHERFCSRCGFYMDCMDKAEKKMRQGKPFRKLICVHPDNKMALDKWTRYLTVPA